MNEHIVKSFDQELLLLDKKIAQMGGLAERLLAQAFDSLEKRDPKLGETVVASDRAIDQLERELQEQTIQMIARRQPVANDLRHIMTVLKIAGDLERTGDLAKNIAKRALAVSGENHPKSLMTGLKHMTELALRQLKDVLDAYAERDADKALVVWRHDEQIDAMYNSLFRELLTYMMEDPATSACARICCSAPRTSSASAITPPTSPRTSTTSCTAPRWRTTARRVTTRARR
jgi:phosphate transport system protein